MKLLQLIIGTSLKSPICLVTNPNPVYSQLIHDNIETLIIFLFLFLVYCIMRLMSDYIASDGSVIDV
jgi:hypothetical protein